MTQRLTLAGSNLGRSESAPELADPAACGLEGLGDGVEDARRLTAEITLLMDLVCQVRRLPTHTQQT